MSGRRLARGRRLGCALALAVTAALAGDPAPGAPADAAPADEGPWAVWQERVGEARQAVDRAERRSETAEAAVQKMRHRRRPRGDAREALFAERDAARAERAAAERALAELLEHARLAGVPPGLLRAEEEPPADASE